MPGANAVPETTGTTLTEEQIERRLRAIAAGFSHLTRSPVIHWPSEAGLAYEDVTFPSWDGVPLEGWFIPSTGSDKIVIANHPMGFSRSGMPSHLEPWNSTSGPSGNGFEVDFIPDYRVLHDAGYNVLAYDLRNYGLSGATNGALSSSGRFESRDVLGALRHVRERPDTRGMAIALLSRCLGGSATMFAMTTHPGEFRDARCLVVPEPVIPKTLCACQLDLAGIPPDRIDDLERRIVLETGLGFDKRDTRARARNVRVPAFLYQVRDEALTRASDVRALFDNIPVADKQLAWIDGTTARWDGYLEFQRRPKPVLDFLARHIC